MAIKGDIDTVPEMVEENKVELWRKDPMAAMSLASIEKRKMLNWWARFIISGMIFLTFLILLYLLFFSTLIDGHRDLVNILVGAYVAVLAKSTDYWFKDKDDPEQKESETLSANGNDSSEEI